MRLVPVCQSCTCTCTEGSAIADNEVASYPGALTCVQHSAVHVLCGHATCLAHGPSMGWRIGMEALELDTFRCWTPLETLRPLARLAEISVSRALLPLWPLTTGPASEPPPLRLVMRARRVPAGTALYRPGATGSAHAPFCPPSQNHAPPTAAPDSGPGCFPPALSSQ